MILFAARTSSEQPVWVWLAVLGGVALIAAVFYLLSLWDKKKHGTRGHSTGTLAGGAMLELQSLLEPSKRHVIEARKERKQSAEDGDKPNPGAPRASS